MVAEGGRGIDAGRGPEEGINREGVTKYYESLVIPGSKLSKVKVYK